MDAIWSFVLVLTVCSAVFGIGGLIAEAVRGWFYEEGMYDDDDDI